MPRYDVENRYIRYLIGMSVASFVRDVRPSSIAGLSTLEFGAACVCIDYTYLGKFPVVTATTTKQGFSPC